jgi:transcriptional regulator with XRE-family HTH domain
MRPRLAGRASAGEDATVRAVCAIVMLTTVHDRRYRWGESAYPGTTTTWHTTGLSGEYDEVTMAGRRRDQLAEFLRSRRGRLAPANLGLPAGPRRRTPGLRREEVAQLAGVGVTWYTWLEQGRPINASVHVLDAIARTLRLDEAEREHLYRLAEVPSVPKATDERLRPEVQVVLDALVPIPAVVYNGFFDALAWNATYDALFPRLTTAPIGERNAVWQMFTIPWCCSPIGDRDRELCTMVGSLRATYARHLGEAAWISFVDRMSAASPDFATLWAKHQVTGAESPVKIFLQSPGERSIQVTATSFAVTATPESRMVVYAPVDDDTRAQLVELTANPPGITYCARHAEGRQRRA